MSLLKPAFATEAKIQASLLGFNVDEDEVANEIDNEINSNKIVIYTCSLSPFSMEALAMRDGTGYDYANIELGAKWFLLGGKNSVKRLALLEQVKSGATSLPKVFVSGQCIGGCAELAEAVKLGSFDVTLKQNGTTMQANKFSFFQCIELTKFGIIGLLAGGFALAPFSFIRDVILPPDSVQSGLAQWVYNTDTGSLMDALFAIVYRYCLREDDDNKMLNMGVIGAFVLFQTLSRVAVSSYCTAAPLDCGGPFIGYFDWSIITQVAFNSLESVTLFGGTAAAMDWAFDRGLLSKFC